MAVQRNTGGAETAKQIVEANYSDDAFYSQFKRVRNKIRNFDTAKFVGACLRYLHSPANKQLDYLERHPWLVLLLVKWTLVDQDAFVPGRRVPTEHQFVNMLNLMRDFGGERIARMPSEYDDVRLFLRAMAYQQFFYQRDISFTAIARQLFYFGSVAPDHYIRTRFSDLVGIEVHRFLELAQGLLAWFADGKEKLITEDWFATLKGAYSQQELSAFFNALAKSMEDVRVELLKRDLDNLNKGRQARSSSEYWEQTPFVNFPLLKSARGYICVDQHVLFQCIEHYVYNRLRTDNAYLFMAHFGPLFEQYVERAIANMSLPFAKENEIKKILGEESAVIDFIIADGDSNIFIDAKAAEMSYQGKSTHESVELAKYLETSALKAIKQAHAVLAELSQSTDDKVVFRQRSKNYLIAVTYSELYVGSGRTLAACVGEEKLRSLTARNPAHLRIPLENMYFMTIKEFELLSAAVGSKKTTFTRALEHAIAEDANPQTQKFEFQQHLASSGIALGEPEYLVSKAISELEALGDRLGASKAGPAQ